MAAAGARQPVHKTQDSREQLFPVSTGGKEGVRDESPGVGKGLPKTSSEWAHVRSAGQVPSLVPLYLCVCERERERSGGGSGGCIYLKKRQWALGCFFSGISTFCVPRHRTETFQLHLGSHALSPNPFPPPPLPPMNEPLTPDTSGEEARGRVYSFLHFVNGILDSIQEKRREEGQEFKGK